MFETLEDRRVLAFGDMANLSLHGLVCDDVDDNGQCNPGEELQGVRVFVDAQASITDKSGAWSVFVPAGQHEVHVAGRGFDGIASTKVDTSRSVDMQFMSGRAHGVVDSAHWHNSWLAEDVNDDRIVSPLDALVIINQLNDSGPGLLTTGFETPLSQFVDVNADRYLTPMDALGVINRLNAPRPISEAPLPSAGLVAFWDVLADPESEGPATGNSSGDSSEQRVNDLVHGWQTVSFEQTAVAANSGGDQVIAFSGNGPGDNAGVFFRLFAVDAGPQSPVIRANSTVRESQSAPSVAMDDGGNFVMMWQGRGTGDQDGIFAQWFDRQRQPLGDETRINTTTGGLQGQVAVADTPDGATVAVWSGAGTDDPDGIFLRRYDPSHQPLGEEFRVNQNTADAQSEPAVAISPDGSFVVTWSSRHQDGGDWGIFARRFDRDGQPLSDEFLVNTERSGSQQAPSVSLDAAGNFVVVWSSYTDAQNGWDVFARQFDSTGQPGGNQFLVNSNIAGTQRNPSVAMWPQGTFAVSWDSGTPDGSGWEIQAQVFSAAGRPESEAVQVNQNVAGYASGHQQSTSLVTDAAGEATIVWSGKGADDRQGVYAVNLQAASTNQPPKLATIPDRVIDELMEFTFTAFATDAENDQLTFSLDRAPTGAAIDAQSGRFSWTPTEAQGPDAFAVTIRIADGRGGSDSGTFILAVKEVNQAPVLEALADQAIDEETLLTFTATATDADIPANTLVFSLSGNVPAGATIDPLTGVFSWQPTETQGAGVYLFSVVVSDRGTPELSDAQEITVTVREVNRKPTITPIADQTISENTVFVVAPSATDPDLPADVLTYSLSRAPEGATINPTTGVVN